MSASPAALSFPGQFLVSERGGLARPGWEEHRLGGLSVATAPGLTVTPVCWAEGDTCALLLGTVISGSQLLTSEPIGLARRAGGVDDLERFLGGLGGRHVAVVDAAGAQRLYLDAAGNRSAVYSPARRVAASTPLLLDPEGYDANLDHELAAALPKPLGHTWYAGTVTAHHGVLRLLPNHFLDLKTWTAQRFRGLEPSPPCSPEEALPEIAAIVSDTLTALSNGRGVSMPLSAGHDSRLLLACSRDIAADMQCFTFVESQLSPDNQIPRELARRAGLSWRPLEVITATPEQANAFMIRTGHVIHSRIREIHPTLAKLDPTRIVTPGMAGEIARAYHRRDSTSSDRLDARRLAAVIRVPPHPRMLDSLTTWLADLHGLPERWILDLAYLELDQAGWGGPQMYGTDPYGDTLPPLCHPRVLELVMALPESYRGANRLVTDACRQRWPALLKLPFNRLIGWPRVRNGLARRARRLVRLGAR